MYIFKKGQFKNEQGLVGKIRLITHCLLKKGKAITLATFGQMNYLQQRRLVFLKVIVLTNQYQKT